jgi:hypothetical protein
MYIYFYVEKYLLYETDVKDIQGRAHDNVEKLWAQPFYMLCTCIYLDVKELIYIYVCNKLLSNYKS